jgi:hypothetical protein
MALYFVLVVCLIPLVCLSFPSRSLCATQLTGYRLIRVRDRIREETRSFWFWRPFKVKESVGTWFECHLLVLKEFLQMLVDIPVLRMPFFFIFSVFLFSNFLFLCSLFFSDGSDRDLHFLACSCVFD